MFKVKAFDHLAAGPPQLVLTLYYILEKYKTNLKLWNELYDYFVCHKYSIAINFLLWHANTNNFKRINQVFEKVELL